MTEVFNRKSEKQLRRMLRKTMPGAELALWSRIRRKQLPGQRFRRQYSVGPYVIDFYCPALKLAIELDGDSHSEATKEHDRQRQASIETYGVHFLIYANVDVFENLDGVLDDIGEVMKTMLSGTE